MPETKELCFLVFCWGGITQRWMAESPTVDSFMGGCQGFFRRVDVLTVEAAQISAKSLATQCMLIIASSCILSSRPPQMNLPMHAANNCCCCFQSLRAPPLPSHHPSRRLLFLPLLASRSGAAAENAAAFNASIIARYSDWKRIECGSCVF